MAKKIIIPIMLFFTIPYLPRAQYIQVTRITDDVIVLSPRGFNNMTVVRKVGGNMTAVRTDSGIVVVDSFVSPQAGRDARDLIEDHFPGVPIKYLINTHHHTDHVQGNESFQDGCIIGHVNLEGRVSHPPSLQIISDTILKLGGKTFEILYFGTAHTDNDLVVLDREDNLLIVGDLLCHRKCYILGSESDATNWILILEKLIECSDEYDYVIPGHGGVVVGVDGLIEQRDYLQDLCDGVISARQRDLTLNQAKKEMRLEQYKEYMMYDRIYLDIEAAWKHIEK